MSIGMMILIFHLLLAHCPTRNWPNMVSVFIQCLSKVCPTGEIKILTLDWTGTGQTLDLCVQSLSKVFEDGQILDKVLTDYGLGLDSDWTDPVLGQRLDKVWTNIGQNLDKGWISCPTFVRPPFGK